MSEDAAEELLAAIRDKFGSRMTPVEWSWCTPQVASVYVSCRTKLTSRPRRLRWVRTGYAYQPPALGTYRRRRAACPQGPTYSTYWVRVPASGVPYVPRTVAPQLLRLAGYLPRCSPATLSAAAS